MKKLLGLAFVSLLAGCSVGQNDFNCSSGDENALCGSSRTIYEVTNGELKTNDTLTYVKDGKKQQMSVSDLKKMQKGDLYHAASISENSTHQADSLSVPLSFNFDGDVLRHDVRVMRIWIAPFVDSNDNLHLSSMVYTDIAHRSWQIGTIDPNTKQSITSPMVAPLVTPEPENLDTKKYRVPEKEKPALQTLFDSNRK
ncbi:type IV conjugative transfer system lipoprotein TraV [Vibrio cholerae]|nr:type IV conjugative transfer system lipoprotein TraV [Vibrio cholerae]